MGIHIPWVVDVFSGWYTQSVDDKGRVAVPASFRQMLARMEGLPLFVTPISIRNQPHLEVYPAPEFKRIADQIQAVQDRARSEVLKRAFFGRSVSVDFDSQGRIMLPGWLREAGALGGKVVFEGQITRIDIWDEARYEALELDPAELEEALESIRR